MPAKAGASVEETVRQLHSVPVRSADSERLELPTKATPSPPARMKMQALGWKATGNVLEAALASGVPVWEGFGVALGVPAARDDQGVPTVHREGVPERDHERVLEDDAFGGRVAEGAGRAGGRCHQVSHQCRACRSLTGVSLWIFAETGGIVTGIVPSPQHVKRM
jgi:hypothetical protein